MSFNLRPFPDDFKVAVVCARFNPEITEPLLSGCSEELKNLGFNSAQVSVFKVPGAIEIPLVVQQALLAGFDGVIALGAVIRGETSHYDYVCNSVERGCSQLMLEFNAPVIFGVLTTENEEQALDRIGGRHGHKGIECARALKEMLELQLLFEQNKGEKDVAEGTIHN